MISGTLLIAWNWNGSNSLRPAIYGVASGKSKRLREPSCWTMKNEMPTSNVCPKTRNCTLKIIWHWCESIFIKSPCNICRRMCKRKPSVRLSRRMLARTFFWEPMSRCRRLLLVRTTKRWTWKKARYILCRTIWPPIWLSTGRCSWFEWGGLRWGGWDGGVCSESLPATVNDFDLGIFFKLNKVNFVEIPKRVLRVLAAKLAFSGKFEEIGGNSRKSAENSRKSAGIQKNLQEFKRICGNSRKSAGV